MPSPTVSGFDLRLMRVALGVRQREIAARMGVSSARVRAIECHRRPTDTALERYLAALADRGRAA